MRKLSQDELVAIDGGWWRDALDFAAGVCAGTALVRGIAAVATVAVPGGAVVWGAIGIGCVVVGGAAAGT